MDTFAVCARALSCSFLFFATLNLASSCFMLLKSVSTACSWVAICDLRLLLISSCWFLRSSAALAASSSPFSSASFARFSHSCADAKYIRHTLLSPGEAMSDLTDNKLPRELARPKTRRGIGCS